MVGTYRDTELDVARSLAKALQELLRRRMVHDVILKRLPQTDVSAMLQGRSGQEPPARLVETVYHETEGNPFFVEEVFKHLAEEGKLFDADGQWHVDLRIDELDVPRGVLLVIGHRLERISEECRRILARAAVVGRGISFKLMNEVIDVDEDTLIDAIEEAEQAQLILTVTRQEEDRITFAHELIRQTLLNDLSLPRRRRLHLRAAEAMEKLYAGAVEDRAADLAYHFYHAGGDSEKIIEYAVMAAERATAQTAYEEAVDQYQRALQALERQRPVDELRHCNLLLALGRAYGNAGTPGQAKETFLRVTEIAGKLPAPEQFVEATLGLHRFMYLVGFSDDQFLDLMEEGLALLGQEDSALRATLLGHLSITLEGTGDERRFSLSEEAVSMARRVGNPKALYYALWGRTFIWDRPLVKKMADANACAKLEQEIGARGSANWALIFLCHYCWEQGDMDAAQMHLAALRKVATELSVPDTMSWVKFIESTNAQMTGNFDDAERLAFEAFALGQKVFKEHSAQKLGLQIFTIRLLQGRLDEVDETFQHDPGRGRQIPILRAGSAYLHFMLERKEQARKKFEDIATHDFVDLPRDAVLFVTLTLLSELAAEFGDTRRSALIYNIWRPYADHLCMIGIANGCFGATTHWLGMLASTMKKWDIAAEHFEDAIETNTRIGALPFLARSKHEYARMLMERGDSGDKEKAKALLIEATATSRDIGMPTFLEDAEELLARL
jgi:tetratricopeptide (TPR) repeat protein